MATRPGRDEAAPYYFTYIDRVPDGDIRELLETTGAAAAGELRAIGDARSLHRYAADKWTLRDVAGHLADTERLFQARAFWFARGFDTPLPSFDQHVAVAAARADDRAWTDLVEDFAAARAGNVSFFRSLPPDAWGRRGIASDCPFSVRALAYLAVGHVLHHMAIVRDKYL